MFTPKISARAYASSISVLALVAVQGTTFFVQPAFANSHATTEEIIIDDSHGGGSGSHDGGHDDGHDDGDHEDGDHGDGGHGGGDHGDGSGGSGGHGDGDGGEGERSGNAGAGDQGQGGRPVWAKEGLPEVELGRLNVVRSPDRVIDRAYLEALGSFTPEMVDFYSLNLEQMTKELSLNWDNISLIDSPLQNLALFRDALDGTSVLTTVGVETDNDTLLAVFLGTASDKNIPITPETAYAVSAMLDQPLSESEAAELAAEAEKVRLAIVAGHG